MAAQRVVSADSHMTEPADLWTERLDKKFRDRAPHVVKNEGRPGYSFIAPGINPFPVAGGFASGRSGQELKDHMSKGYEAARPSGWDPVERLKDQEIDGVQAEVLYTTLGMPLFQMDDADLQRACFEVYNNWLSEFCSHDPKRLYGIALVSLEDIGEGVKELERCAKEGLRGAMIWGSPPEDKPYDDHVYDPFWQAAAELHMPLSLHVITGKSKESKINFSQIAVQGMNVLHEVQRSLTTLIFGGVLERFPELPIVSAENDTGWFPHYMYRLDHIYEKFGTMMKEPLPQKPSEYVKRQVWATFQDDPVGPANYKFFGTDNYMWASDFPHADSTWPDSLQVIKKDFAGVPEDVTQKIIYENACKLYRIEIEQ
jgi:predicted TIM-barrel fold metal-dependent hydrolase